MAKVSGPLMSMDARGKYAGTLVFSGWKGRATVRQLVTPSNPMSNAQTKVRNQMRVTAIIQKFVKASVRKGDGRLKTDKELIVDKTPAGQAWNGFLVKTIIGAGGLAYADSVAAWTALPAGDKAAWDAAAAAQVPPITGVPQYTEGNAAGVALSAGEVYFIYQRALYLLGLRGAPGAAVPVYA